MAACYPTIAANAPNLLRDVRNTMVARLQERCHKEFDKIMASRQVVPKLNELENLVSEAASRRVVGDGVGESAQPPIPPHQLPAEAIVAAHISRPLAAQRSQLNARLQNSQALNERLYAEIEAQRSEIEGLLSVLERTLADVDGANSLLAGVVDEIAREARDVEVEITGV
ncbi:Nnf1 [Ceratocystis platani]|uniref:Nnf1 n=2 Tax=Ceratocystis TaxID=5157 RepID=A0A0F8B845_CERFI|nr:Nnf1 [Ceratocystis platani]